MRNLTTDERQIVARLEEARLEAVRLFRDYETANQRYLALYEEARAAGLLLGPEALGLIQAVRERAEEGDETALAMLQDQPDDWTLAQRAVELLRQLKKGQRP